jgi:hypothetical protein
MTKFDFKQIFQKLFEHFHISNVSITSMQSLENVSLKVWEKFINMYFSPEKYPNTFKESMCPWYGKFGECQPKGARGVHYTKSVLYMKTPAPTVRHSPLYKPDALCVTRPISHSPKLDFSYFYQGQITLLKILYVTRSFSNHVLVCEFDLLHFRAINTHVLLKIIHSSYRRTDSKTDYVRTT